MIHLKKDVLARTRAVQPEPFIAILMAVKNGEDFLADQLASISAQKHKNWHLFAADDISSDRSRSIIRDFGDREHRVTLLNGSGSGCAVNFMNLLSYVVEQARQEVWVAFSDQDDVWLPDRLSRGVARLQLEPEDILGLYCSSTWVCDENLGNLRLSPTCPREPNFSNALVQNIASGNTILLNQAAARLVTKATENADLIVAHDWWIYQIITGAGGKVIYDDIPTLLYRQHGANLVGTSLGLRASLYRIKLVMQGRYRSWNETNIAALQKGSFYLTKQNQEKLDAFKIMRDATLHNRMRGLYNLRLVRQRYLGQIALWIATILRLV